MSTYVISEKELQELEEVSINALIKQCLPPIDAILFSKYKEDCHEPTKNVR